MASSQIIDDVLNFIKKKLYFLADYHRLCVTHVQARIDEVN